MENALKTNEDYGPYLSLATISQIADELNKRYRYVLVSCLGDIRKEESRDSVPDICYRGGPAAVCGVAHVTAELLTRAVANAACVDETTEEGEEENDE
jgi:hypothetical protein